MEYLLLGAITEKGQALSPADLEAWMAEIGAWYEKQGSAGTLADPGHQLTPPGQARTIRASEVTDGPYIEAKEFVGGYYIIDVADRDRALELAGQIPDASIDRLGVEVRPVMFEAGLEM